MIELKNINYTVNSATNKKEILKNINLTFAKGKITVITGANGSGKSTLAKLIMGLNKATSGNIYYNGKDKKKTGKNGETEEVDGEIDLILQENGILYPIEIKMSTMPKASMASEFDVLDGVPDKKRGMGAIVCLLDRKMYLRENLVALPLEYL